MKTLLGILTICVACVGQAKATGCHVQQFRAPIVQYQVAPLVQYQIVSPHYNVVEVQDLRVQHYVQPQRVRVIQKNVVKQPIVIRQRNVEKVRKVREFSRQRVTEKVNY